MESVVKRNDTTASNFSRENDEKVKNDRLRGDFTRTEIFGGKSQFAGVEGRGWKKKKITTIRPSPCGLAVNHDVVGA